MTNTKIMTSFKASYEGELVYCAARESMKTFLRRVMTGLDSLQKETGMTFEQFPVAKRKAWLELTREIGQAWAKHDPDRCQDNLDEIRQLCENFLPRAEKLINYYLKKNDKKEISL